MQQRLRNEIKSALQLTNGELTYEMVTKMEYLGMIVSGLKRSESRMVNLTNHFLCLYRDSSNVSIASIS